jgi:hypothetical protein
MAAVDKLLGAAVQSVKTSGLLESMARMGVVSAVNSDGTVDVSRAGDVFPSVRLLSGYESPVVGDTVQMVKTMGGWVCVGRLAASSAPNIQSGSVTFPTGTDSTWLTVDVTFPRAFAATPRVVMTPNSAIAAASTDLTWAISSPSATGFTARYRRNNSSTSTTTFCWIATTY